MKTEDIFKSLDKEETDEIVSNFFVNNIGYKGKIFWRQLNLNDNFSTHIVILKDDINRLKKSKGGSGVLRQKQWSIFIFNYVDEDYYISQFGYNRNKKNIITPYNYSKFDDYFLSPETKKYDGKRPDNLFRSPAIDYLMQHYIFQLLMTDYKYLFVNAYVYSVICLKNNKLNKMDFLTFYYNTNYKFTQATYPIIKQKYDINLTSFIVKNIDEELDYIKVSNNDLLDLVRAYKNELPLNEITYNNYNNIVEDIDNGIENIITEGAARTGKTIIAMRLLGKYNDAKLLIMNNHFYSSLIDSFKVMNVEFPDERIFTHGGCYTGINIKNSRILIVDEAQRLSKDYFEKIISSDAMESAVFLGDNLQKLNWHYDRGIDFITDYLEENNLEYNKYYFDQSIGIPRNAVQAIKYLLFNNIEFENQSINTYEINITDNETSFLNAYKEDKLFKKHMTTIYLGIGDFKTDLKGFKRMTLSEVNGIPYFLNSQIKDNRILTTYEVISRELDAVYIVIPPEVYADEEGLHYEDNEELDEYLLNQLYILMTRGKISVNILCKNDTCYNYLKKRLEIIKSNNDVDEEDFLVEEEKEKAVYTESMIREKGITRLIHFTEKSNVNSILKYGLASRQKLDDSDIEYDYNDDLRLDRQNNAICLSVQNPNTFLLKKYKEKYPNKKFVAICIDPIILYKIKNSDGDELAKRRYYNYNAAASDSSYSDYDINYMFGREVSHYNCYGKCWTYNRIGKKDNETTASQAEILFYESIPSKYFLEIKDI